MTASLPALRYPAVPLITHDPYFCVWSFADRLTDDWSRHWTGAPNGMGGLLRVDGQIYRFAGKIRDTEPMTQQTVDVLPTRTVYTFTAGGVRLTLTFLTPSLPHRPDVLSRPLTYVLFETAATDGRKHRVELLYHCNSDWCVNMAEQEVVWGRARLPGLNVLRIASAEQHPLHNCGDNLRIDWGSLYLAVPEKSAATAALAPSTELWRHFSASGRLPESDDLAMPRSSFSGMAAGVAFDLGQVGSKAKTSWLMIAFDDLWSIEYLQAKLPAYWRRNGMTMAELLTTAAAELPTLRTACERYDEQLLADCRRIGGEEYARLGALAFRQAFAAHKLVADRDGTPLFFSKENLSDGCIATVDVTYPSAPLFLLTQPDLVKGMLIPIFHYAELPRWKFSFAPHDLGFYPLANGQIYGGGEKDETDQMPVEESGNMLLLTAALVKFTDDQAFLRRYWPLLSRWAEYLRSKGYDPENQLCTDDFAGHLAHNTNLSLKAILALGAYAQMAATLGETRLAAEYHKIAAGFARRWVKDADAGDHYRLAFDQPDSWSQKYNLVWDRLLELDLFPAHVAVTEMAWYRRMQNSYGLPLDNRKTYTKLDWTIWSATLTGNRQDFDALLQPVYRWLQETPSRVPLTDWYETTDGKQVGFQARSVVGGLFLPLLGNAKLRNKYLQLARSKETGNGAEKQ